MSQCAYPIFVTFMFFQPVAKAQDGGLVGQAGKLIELGKLAVQRGVEEGFFHAGIGQRERLLQKVDTQHGLQGKRRSAVAPEFLRSLVKVAA